MQTAQSALTGNLVRTAGQVDAAVRFRVVGDQDYVSHNLVKAAPDPRDDGMPAHRRESLEIAVSSVLAAGHDCAERWQHGQATLGGVGSCTNASLPGARPINGRFAKRAMR